MYMFIHFAAIYSLCFPLCLSPKYCWCEYSSGMVWVGGSIICRQLWVSRYPNHSPARDLMALSIAPGQLGKAAENNEQHCCACCTCMMVVVTGSDGYITRVGVCPRARSSNPGSPVPAHHLLSSIQWEIQKNAHSKTQDKFSCREILVIHIITTCVKEGNPKAFSKFSLKSSPKIDSKLSQSCVKIVSKVSKVVS